MAVTWELTGIQEQSFTMRFNIYVKKTTLEGVFTENDGYELVAEDVPGRVMSRSDASAYIAGLGAASRDQMDTTDAIRLPAIYDGENLLSLGKDTHINLLSGGDGEEGDWWALQGEAKALTFRAKTKVYLGVKTTAPAISA